MRGSDEDGASIIGILLREDWKDYSGVMANARKYRERKNACQHNILERQWQEKDRLLFTRKDELRRVIDALQRTVVDPLPQPTS